MKSYKLTLSLVSLLVIFSMLLAGCGVNATVDTPVPAAQPTNTTGTGGTGASDVTPTAMMAGETPTAMTSGGSTFTGDTIKIGVDLPTSGAETSDGVPTRNGVQLAVDQANTAGGVKVGDKTYKLEMVALDDAVNGVHNPEQGAKNAQSFIADPAVMAIVGPFNSNVARAEMPLLNQAGLANISPANTNETLTKPQYGKTKAFRPTGKVTYFRVCTTDDVQGPAAADYMYDKLGLKNIYILNDTETYGKGLADNVQKEFTAKGGKVIDNKGVPKGTLDLHTILTTVAGSNPKPDGLFYGCTSSTGCPLARKQMKDVGLDIPFVGGDGIVNTQFTDQAGEAANGSYGTVAAVNAATLPEAKQFLADYKAKFGSDVGSYSANAYDAANIIIDALKRAGTVSRSAVVDALQKTKDYKGVIGTTGFDENGDTTNKWISINEVKDGKWTFVDQIKFEK